MKNTMNNQTILNTKVFKMHTNDREAVEDAMQQFRKEYAVVGNESYQCTDAMWHLLYYIAK